MPGGRIYFKIEKCSCSHLLVIVHPLFSYCDPSCWIVIPALFMDVCVLVVVRVVAVFFRKPVGVKVRLLMTMVDTDEAGREMTLGL